MTEQQKLEIARRHVEAIKGFYVHLAVFVLVIAILEADFAGPIWWAQWPFLAWGIGVLGHAVAVFGRRPADLARWEARQVEEIKRELDAQDRAAQPPAA